MPVPITALYLAIFALFASGLYVMCGRIRAPQRISLGDGGREDLQLAMRRHANFVENVPYFMIMMCALELNGALRAEHRYVHLDLFEGWLRFLSVPGNFFVRASAGTTGGSCAGWRTSSRKLHGPPAHHPHAGGWPGPEWSPAHRAGKSRDP